MSHLQMQEIERSASCASLSMLHIAGMYSNTQYRKAWVTPVAGCFIRLFGHVHLILTAGWQCRLPAAPCSNQRVGATRQQANIVECMLLLTVWRAQVFRMLLKDLL